VGGGGLEAWCDRADSAQGRSQAKRPTCDGAIHPALRQVLEQTGPDKRGDYVLPETAVKYAAGGTSKRQVINSIQEHFTSQGIKTYAPGTGPGTGKRAVVKIGFHSLRHSFVSICREANVPLSVVESIVGHHNPAMTRHYTHTGELASRAAVACLPILVGDTKPESPKRDAEAILIQVAGLVEGLTAETGRHSALSCWRWWRRYKGEWTNERGGETLRTDSPRPDPPGKSCQGGAPSSRPWAGKR